MTWLVATLLVLALLAIVWVSRGRRERRQAELDRRRTAEERQRAYDERRERRRRMNLPDDEERP